MGSEHHSSHTIYHTDQWARSPNMPLGGWQRWCWWEGPGRLWRVRNYSRWPERSQRRAEPGPNSETAFVVETKQKLWVVVPMFLEPTHPLNNAHLHVFTLCHTRLVAGLCVYWHSLSFRLSLAICHTCIHQFPPISEQCQSSCREGVLPRRQEYKHTKLLQTESTASGWDPNDVLVQSWHFIKAIYYSRPCTWVFYQS